MNALVAAAAAVVRCLPEACGEWACRTVAAVAGWVIPSRRRLADEQLAAAWPDGAPTDGRAVYTHLARTAWDFIRWRRHQREAYRRVRVAPDALDPLAAGGVVVTGHLGSWELVAAALAARVSPPVLLDGQTSRWDRSLGSTTATARGAADDLRGLAAGRAFDGR